MELLAPVGNWENFFAALEAGADAVYVGAPGLNARNLARDLRLEEIGAMIRLCRAQGRRLYVAANSLILEHELPPVVETLALLESLKPDGLIVQDLGLINLVRDQFPGLPLHASTLMLAHNAESVRFLSRLGCRRVVLARELTVKEIAAIARKSDAELEVFIHGAMCFSYSGLCLFSSYLGGKSGLRGRCVQPCRRRYQWRGRGGKSGGGSYLFSMNDLSGLEVVPELRRLGVAALKIEGRLRSAHYVSHVVQAYRLMLDAAEQDFNEALARAKGLVAGAMGRTTASGYFLSPQPKTAITQQYSGNTGLHLGRLKGIGRWDNEPYGELVLKEPVAVGDRLRLHFESSGERLAFRLQVIEQDERKIRQAEAGAAVRLSLPGGVERQPSGRIELYKIDVRSMSGPAAVPDQEIEAIGRELSRNRTRLAGRIKAIRNRLGIVPARQNNPVKIDPKRQRQRNTGRSSGPPLEWWLKTDSPRLVLGRLPFVPDRLVLTLNDGMAAQAGRIRKTLGRRARQVIWALPPVLIGAEFDRMRTRVASLIRSGFKSFQIGHFSQIALFGSERVHLFGDYTLNVMNAKAAHMTAGLGLEMVQAAIELDRNGLQALLGDMQKNTVLLKERGPVAGNRIRLGLTVYGAPALFTARLAPDHFQIERTLASPKEELFVIHKEKGATRTYPRRPFSLLPYLDELKSAGLDYAVVDLSGSPVDRKALQELDDRLNGRGRPAVLPTFNYLGKLE